MWPPSTATKQIILLRRPNDVHSTRHLVHSLHCAHAVNLVLLSFLNFIRTLRISPIAIRTNERLARRGMLQANTYNGHKECCTTDVFKTDGHEDDKNTTRKISHRILGKSERMSSLSLWVHSFDFTACYALCWIIIIISLRVATRSRNIWNDDFAENLQQCIQKIPWHRWRGRRCQARQPRTTYWINSLASQFESIFDSRRCRRRRHHQQRRIFLVNNYSITHHPFDCGTKCIFARLLNRV